MKKSVILLVFLGAITGCLFSLIAGRQTREIQAFKYESVAKNLGQGHVFFSVQMSLPVVTADKVIYQKTPDKVFVKWVNLTWPILKILQDREATLDAHLAGYRPYRDVLQFPLESLALAGLDAVKGTLACQGKPTGSHFSSWACTFDPAGEKPIFITLGCLTDVQTPWTQMVCPDIRLTMPLGRAVAAYARYAQSRGIDFPAPRGEALDIQIMLPEKPLFMLFQEGMPGAKAGVLSAP